MAGHQQRMCLVSGGLKTQCLTDCSRPQDGDDGARLLLVYWDSVHLLSKVSTYAGWGVWYPPLLFTQPVWMLKVLRENQPPIVGRNLGT